MEITVTIKVKHDLDDLRCTYGKGVLELGRGIAIAFASDLVNRHVKRRFNADRGLHSRA